MISSLRSLVLGLAVAVSPYALASAPALQGPLTLFETPQPLGHAEFTNAIDRAKTSIQMMMYHLSDDAVVNSLIAAQGRGVNVRVILDQKILTGTVALAIQKRMQAAGVQVMASSWALHLTHTKSMIVDGQTAFITSVNLAKVPDRTRDYGLILKDAAAIAEMSAVFEGDWANAKTGGAETPKLSNPNLVWSPVNARDRIVALIGSATKSVRSTVENITDDAIVQALGQAAGRGVSVRFIVPMCDEAKPPTMNYPALGKLAAMQVQTRVMPAPATAMLPYMHGKMIVVDDLQVFIGSENFSYDSLGKNRELGVIFSDASIAQKMAQTFESDWAVSVAVPSPTPDPYTCKAM